jgi:hypothetical protein
VTVAGEPKRGPVTPAGRRIRELRRVVAPAGGPVLIVAAVLVVLHRVAFGRDVPIEYGTDVLAYWVPNLCFMGKSLAAGHIPAWNPHVMGGLPFAADPGAGWLNLPAMVLFTILPCDVALRAHIVLQPILAGLGLYWFLRSEGLSRVSATVGGLAISVPVAGSSLALSLGFSTSLAWTTITLAAVSRFLHSERWAGRLAWAALTAVAWGQVAVAHAQWLIVATLAVVVYVGVRLVVDLAGRRRTVGQAGAVAGLLAVALPLVNLAYFVRLSYLSRTTLGLGYEKLDLLSRRLTGHGAQAFSLPIQLHRVWMLRLALSPGLFLGATVLALVFAGWGAKRLRSLFIAFAVFGALCYILSLQETGEAGASFLRRSSFGTSYLHAPYRFATGVLISIAVLAAIGAEGWRRTRGGALPRRLLMIAPAVVLWGVLPAVLGASPRTLAPLAWGAAAAAIALTVAAIRPSLSLLLPLVLAVELVASGLAGASAAGRTTAKLGPVFLPNRQPIDLAAYVREGPIARALSEHGGSRFLSLDPSSWSSTGYHLHWSQQFWGLMGQQRSMVFGLEEAQGYNSNQLVRYWMFVRGAESKSIRYSAGFFVHPPAVALDLLQVNWAIGRAGRDPPVDGAKPMATEGQWVLYGLPVVYPRASVVGSWQVVTSPDAALAEVTDPAFEPAAQVLLEGSPGITPNTAPGRPGTAAYRAMGDQAARVDVEAPGPSIVLVRNVYDPGWHATVDGRPARVLPADYLDQGIPVPAGRHTIVLSYDEPLVGEGLIGSGVALTVLFGLAVAFRRRRPGPFLLKTSV